MIYKQKAAEKIGAEGCYFLSLVFIAEKMLGHEIDVFALYDKCLKSGWADEDCYMQNPAAMMTHLLGKPVEIRKSYDLDYKLKVNEREISCYERKATGVTYYHFVVTANGTVIYDPLGESRTVSEGTPVSKRILTIG